MARRTNHTALASVHALYQAVEQPQRWAQSLTQIADHVGADHVVLDLREAFEPLTNELLSARVEPLHVERFVAHPEYPGLRQLLTRAPQGRALHSEAFMDARLRARSAFYADVIHPMGGHHALLARAAPNASGGDAILAACRSGKRLSFGELERGKLQALLPHVETALRLRRQLARQDVELWWQAHVIEALPMGVILLNEHGRACHMNPAAESLITRKDFLALSSQRTLTAIAPQAARPLAMAIQCMVAGNPAQAQTTMQVTSVRDTGTLWLRIVPIAPGGPMHDVWGHARLAVLCDVQALHAAQPTSFGNLFAFTPRELALADALSQGQTLAQASRTMKVSLETTRTHLKHLFSKTGTHRQADLLRMLDTCRRWSYAEVPKQ